MARSNGNPKPTLADTEKFIRESFKEDAKWLATDGLDKIQFNRFVRDYHELTSMEWGFDKDPRSRTPAAMDAYADLRKHVNHHMEVMGLSPGARWGMRINPSTAKPPVLITPNRDPEHLKKVWRRLALSGALGQEPLLLAQAMEAEEDTDNDKEDDDDGNGTT